MKPITGLIPLSLTFLIATIALGQASQISRNAQVEDILDRPVSISLAGHENTEYAVVRAFRAAGAPGGIVSISGCGEQAKRPFVGDAQSLREALDIIVSVDPKHRWAVTDGMVNVLPATRVPALLNLQIAEFMVTNTPSLRGALLELLKLPEVQERITHLDLERLNWEPGLVDLKRPGTPPDEPKPGFSVHCSDATFRDVLNAIARAHGHAVWSYTERRCGGKNQFRLDFVVQ